MSMFIDREHEMYDGDAGDEHHEREPETTVAEAVQNYFSVVSHCDHCGEVREWAPMGRMTCEGWSAFFARAATQPYCQGECGRPRRE